PRVLNILDMLTYFRIENDGKPDGRLVEPANGCPDRPPSSPARRFGAKSVFRHKRGLPLLQLRNRASILQLCETKRVDDVGRRGVPDGWRVGNRSDDKISKVAVDKLRYNKRFNKARSRW